MNINRNCVSSSSANAELEPVEDESGTSGAGESGALHQGASSRISGGSRGGTSHGHRLSALSVLSCLMALLHQVGRSEGSNDTSGTDINSNSTATNGTSDVEGGTTMSAAEIVVVTVIVLVVTVALSVVVAICCHNTGSNEEGEPEPHQLSVIMEVEGGSGSDGNSQVADLGGSASDSSGGSGTELQSTAL
ncbi:hypothetical protein [Candidatus Ichthyocystis sparus]|uniref:hypothetical protein n=2 Tax=Candidatus Ichthyocystis sparus TaxID=1561004 RepID=UPI000B8980A3|nr:hypothetical protein [Candidatus Ichthyocystis sparus]